MNLAITPLILVAVILNAAAQLLLKMGTNVIGPISARHSGVASMLGIVVEPHIVAGLACYVLGAGVWIVTLSRADVSVAYPMLSLAYVVNAFGAWYLFGEALSAQKFAGIAVIMVGVWLLARG